MAEEIISADSSRQSQQCVVHGGVRYSDAQPASALLVKVFEVTLSNKDLLRETRTSASGTYEVQYSQDDFSSSDDSKVGVIVEVYGAENRMLVASAIQYGLASSRTVDLVLPESERGPSEYERYLARMQPILLDTPISQLKCGEGDQHLTYLAGISGVPRDHLEMIVVAEKMARISGDASAKPSKQQRRKSSGSVEKDSPPDRRQSDLFTAPMYYAWMRLGEPHDREQILAEPPAKLAGILKKAGDDNLIPVLTVEELEVMQSDLLSTHTERVLQPATQGAPTSLGDSLDLLSGSEALSNHQKRLIAQLTINQTLGSSAEKTLKAAKLTTKQMRSLDQIVALHQLSGGDGVLLQAARRHLIEKSNVSGNLALHAIVDLDESDWRQILKRAKPELTDPAELGKNAKSIVERTAQLFPNAFLLSRAMRQPNGTQLNADLSELEKLKRHNKNHGFKKRFEELKLNFDAGDHENVRAAFERIKELLNRYPGLELDAVVAEKGSIADKVSEIQRRVSLIDKFVAANPDTNFLALDYAPGSADLEQLKFTGIRGAEKLMVLRTMKAHSRVWRMVGRMAGGALKAQRLMETGFHSAVATAGTTLEEFISDTNFSITEAAAIHSEASDIALDASLDFMAIHSLLQPLGKGTGHPIDNLTQPPEIVNHLKRFDGFKDLFGAQAICRCQHCRSVLGPAAYFVDLMRFIDEKITKLVFDNNSHADQTLKLQYRRPDLWVLPLTCENADTLVPTLEIVNEILENFIDGKQTPAANQRRGKFKKPYTYDWLNRRILLHSLMFCRSSRCKRT